LNSGNQDKEEKDPPSKIAPALSRALALSLILQALALLVSGLILESGLMIQITIVTEIVFWSWFMYLVFLRGQNPTHLDIIFVRWGYPAIWVATLYLSLLIAKLRSV
jgi:hypothetical protein